MVMWDIVAWWYTEGWRQCAVRVRERLDGTLDFFSVDLLMKTLFAPFRQISAGNVRGSFDVQVRAFFDRLISRCIGMAVRLIMIFVGGVTVLGHLLFGLIMLLGWAFVPLLPFVGLLLFLIGWVPWSL